MLSLATARALRAAGLPWQPALLDFFAIPERGLDERVFVLSDMPAALAQIQGQTMMTFEGAVEWALDYVAAGEVVWLPTESQLRELLTARLFMTHGESTAPAQGVAPPVGSAGEPSPALSLSVAPGTCRCKLHYRGQALSFDAPNGAEAYAAALLHLLKFDD